MRFATGTRRLRCLDDQQLGDKLGQQLATTGAVHLERATAPARRASLIPPALLFAAILIAVAIILSVARAGGCSPASAPPYSERG